MGLCGDAIASLIYFLLVLLSITPISKQFLITER